MKKPWETWTLKGLTINEAAPLFEKMERIGMEPWRHAFGVRRVRMADGRKVKLTIQKNGPVPIYTAIAEPAGSGLVVQFTLEMGWLAWNIPEISWEWPLRIYTTQLERNYFNVAQYFSTGSFDQDVWVPTIPVLQMPGWYYESEKWISGVGQVPSIAADQPARYTGLAKLWAQALLAVGTTPSIVLATIGLAGGVNEIGVLRFPSSDEGYIWWLVAITAEGTNAVRLHIPNALKPAVNHLRTGRFIHQLEASSVEAFILAAAEYPDPPVELKTETDMDAVYQDRFVDWWDFCDQRFGTATQNTQKAVATITGGLYGVSPDRYYTTHIARMSAGITQSGDLVVSFSMTTPENWALGTSSGTRVYRPTDVGIWIYSDESDSGIYENNASGIGVPILAFHNPDGTEHIILNGNGPATVLVDTGAVDWGALSAFCGPGSNAGVERYLASVPAGLTVPGTDLSLHARVVQTYTRNVYTLVAGSDYGVGAAFYFNVDGYYYTFPAGCTSEITIGPYTIDEANALSPMVRTPVGAGTSVVTDTNTYTELFGCTLLIGYYPRSYGLLVSLETSVGSAFDQTVTRLFDSEATPYYSTDGVIQDSMVATAIYGRDVTSEIGAGSVSTTIEYKTFPAPTFSGFWRTENGVIYEDNDPEHFNWATGDVAEYPGFYSLTSYGGEEIVALIGQVIYPEGFDISGAASVGAFIGGA